MHELERIREESDDLKSKLAGIEMGLGGIQASTDRSVALLVELDRVKRNMEMCSQALQQTERFMALSKAIEKSLSEGQDLSSVVAQIREVRASLDTLQNVPEFRNATARLAQYEQRLEMQLRPKLLAAIRAGNVPEAVSLAQAYRDVDQADRMARAYREARGDEMVAWLAARGDEPLADMLPGLYNHLLASVAAERSWCEALFGTSHVRAAQGELSARA